MTNFVDSKVGDDALGNRARVVISKETWDKVAESSESARSNPDNDVLSPLNREMVKNLLRKRPGQSVRAGDLVRRGIFDSKSKAEFVLKTMVSRGEIREYPLTENRLTYDVNEEWSDKQLERQPVPVKQLSPLNTKSAENRQRILDYIKNSKYGVATNPNEMADKTGIPRGSVYQLVKKMVERGDIYRHEISPFTYFYTLGSEVKVVKRAATVARPVAKNQALVFDYLSNLPTGTVKSLHEIGTAVGIASPVQQTGSIITALVKKGTVKRHAIGGSYWYEIPGVHDASEVPENLPEPTAGASRGYRHYKTFDKVIDYLSSLPAGTHITGAEIAKQLGLWSGTVVSQGASANACLRSMVRHGLLKRQILNGNAFWYEVPGVHDQPAPEPEPQVPSVFEQPTEQYLSGETAPSPQKTDKTEIITVAMQYAWDNMEDAPAVKRFIEWLKEQ
jgi:O6-methylguanine-DNA--protein-cysteine methyltransferase